MHQNNSVSDMKTFSTTYLAGDTRCIGYFAYEENHQNTPLVLIAPTWQGLNHFAKEKAHLMASMGYRALAVDFYGEGQTTSSVEEAARLMKPLFLDRALLRERMNAALKHGLTLDGVEKNKVGAIGFCLGGLAVIELLRSGAAIQAVVSFHGLLGNCVDDLVAPAVANAPKMHGSLLVLHGAKDPLVPIKDVIHLQQEMTLAGIDWQVYIYGSVGHAFTNPEATDEKGGMYFDPLTNTRSFEAMQLLLEEKFQ